MNQKLFVSLYAGSLLSLGILGGCMLIAESNLITLLSGGILLAFCPALAVALIIHKD